MPKSQNKIIFFKKVLNNKLIINNNTLLINDSFKYSIILKFLLKNYNKIVENPE